MTLYNSISKLYRDEFGKKKVAKASILASFVSTFAGTDLLMMTRSRTFSPSAPVDGWCPALEPKVF